MRDHPGYYPFISYLDFRNLCDHIIDQSSDWFDPDEVRQGDLIYLNLWYIEWFQSEVHDRIKHPYILVSGDVGALEPPTQIKKLLHDPKLAAWFCRNMAFSYHPKLFQIPFGQDLTPFDASIAAKNELIRANAKGSMPKKHLLYMAHYPRQFGDRDKIVKIFEYQPYCFSRNHSDQEWTFTPRPIFYEDMMASFFFFFSIGLEADCVRTWEAFILDCIPIVEHSFLDPLYEGLPIVKVHDWTGIDERFLERQYQELKDIPRKKAYFDYWEPIVREVQAKVKNNDLAFSKLDATQFSTGDLEDLKFILKKKGKEHSTLIYLGALTSIRPLQAAKFSFIDELYVRDGLLNQETFNQFNRYVSDKSLLKKKDKISMVKSDRHLEDVLKLDRTAPVFLDLTYFRAAIQPDPNNFRHHLKSDLKELLKKRKSHSLLCGNMAEDEYVKEVLDQLAAERKLHIEKKGSFWYFNK